MVVPVEGNDALVDVSGKVLFDETDELTDVLVGDPCDVLVHDCGDTFVDDCGDGLVDDCGAGLVDECGDDSNDVLTVEDVVVVDA